MLPLDFIDSKKSTVFYLSSIFCVYLLQHLELPEPMLINLTVRVRGRPSHEATVYCLQGPSVAQASLRSWVGVSLGVLVPSSGIVF